MTTEQCKNCGLSKINNHYSLMGIQCPFYIKHLFYPGGTWWKGWTELQHKFHFHSVLILEDTREDAEASKVRQETNSFLCPSGLVTENCEDSHLWTFFRPCLQSSPRRTMVLDLHSTHERYYLKHTEHLAWERTCDKMPNCSATSAEKSVLRK